ncbi:MAG: hypothetical protein QOG23_2765 [Blastocatellia bacterium]|jgi:hypothetical protein|nr:hypothetical protein [Blastocatellia bacterium]
MSISPLKFITLFIILQMASLSIPSQTGRAHKYRFLIPEGYVGWIRVDFDVVAAPPLPMEGGFYIFKFPDSGRLRTSSSDVLDRRNEFFYYSNDGKYPLSDAGPLDQRLVQEEMSGPGPGHIAPVPNHYRYFFIGPTDVWKRYQVSDKRLLPHELDGPKVGAQSWLTQEELVRMKVREP